MKNSKKDIILNILTITALVILVLAIIAGVVCTGLIMFKVIEVPEWLWWLVVIRG